MFPTLQQTKHGRAIRDGPLWNPVFKLPGRSRRQPLASAQCAFSKLKLSAGARHESCHHKLRWCCNGNSKDTHRGYLNCFWQVNEVSECSLTEPNVMLCYMQCNCSICKLQHINKSCPVCARNSSDILYKNPWRTSEETLNTLQNKQ